MTSSERVKYNKDGKMFIPMNVEGSTWSENFISTPKLIVIGIAIIVLVIMIMLLISRHASLISWIGTILLYLLVFQLPIRYIVFEEQMYYKMYNELKNNEVTTPGLFWDIASVKETNEGAVFTYGSSKIGVLVRIDRDTITGKDAGFKKVHYDALSEFYKDLISKKYSFVQMNIMEKAGNDPRLTELDKLINKSSNKNIQELMKLQIGYTKSITQKTLYESDYILIYTMDTTKIDSIIVDITDSLHKLLMGAFIGYQILGIKDALEFIKEEYGIKYFNHSQATISMLKQYGIAIESPFDIKEIIYSNGESKKLSQDDVIRITSITSGILDGTVEISKISIKNTLERNSDINTEFENLADGFGSNVLSTGNIDRVESGKTKIAKKGKSKKTEKIKS